MRGWPIVWGLVEKEYITVLEQNPLPHDRQEQRETGGASVLMSPSKVHSNDLNFLKKALSPPTMPHRSLRDT